MRGLAAREILKAVRKRRGIPERDKEELIQRLRIQARLERSGYEMIRLTETRATLGEPFACARYGECIVTFRHTDAHYVDLDGLENAVASLLSSKIRRMPDMAWQYVLNVAKRWAKERKPIRHPLWGK